MVDRLNAGQKQGIWNPLLCPLTPVTTDRDLTAKRSLSALRRWSVALCDWPPDRIFGSPCLSPFSMGFMFNAQPLVQLPFAGNSRRRYTTSKILRSGSAIRQPVPS